MSPDEITHAADEGQDACHWLTPSLPDIDATHWLPYLTAAELGLDIPKLTLDATTGALLTDACEVGV